MARRPRLCLPGVPLHLTHRGTDRCAIFRDAQDFRTYRYVLHEASRRTRCEIHAYVLMTNHVHLLATPTLQGGVGFMIRLVGRQYVQYFNRRHGRTGTLWEGRYRSSIIDSDAYLLACMRYIELNPVRAGITRHPREYAWSSYSANAELEIDPIITPHQLYERLGPTATVRSAEYRDMITAGRACHTTDSELREATRGGRILGSSDFRRRVVERLELPSEPHMHGGARR